LVANHSNVASKMYESRDYFLKNTFCLDLRRKKRSFLNHLATIFVDIIVLKNVAF
jgi:hypothetical protein